MDKDYHVSWSKTSVVITLAVLAVVIAIMVELLKEDTPIVSVEFLIIGLVLICLLYVASYTPVRIELSDNTLTIHRVLGSTHIPIDSISGCKRYYPTFLKKVCGSGGFCGSLGWYHTTETGSFVSNVTDWTKAILIDAGTKKYMVSCNDPNKLISDIDGLKNRINAYARHGITE